MSKESQRSSILLLVGLAGLVVSILTGLQDHYSFLQFLCTTACWETAEITLLHLPFWVWGVLFYIVVILCAWFRKDRVFWIVAPAAGVEAALVWIMFQMKAPCIFCITNAVVVVALLVLASKKTTFWQEAALFLLFLLMSTAWIPFENRAIASAPGLGKPEANIVAKVDDEIITEQRLEVNLGSKLLDMKKDIYRMKKEKLDQIIADIILLKEAKKKDQPLEKFFEEVAPPANQFPVSEAEIKTYLDENQDRIRDWKGTVEELRERVKAFLEQQKRFKQISAYAHSLEPQYGVQINLPIPQPPNVKVDIAGAPSLGPEDAPVTVVEFSDYQCPACRSTHEVVKQVKAMYGNQVRWIFKDYPLKIHKEAFKAAEAAHCAEEQGKFWEYQERAFTAGKLDPDSLFNLAAEMGMDKDKFRECLQSGKYKDYINESIQDASRTGIDRTPSFIINGTVFSGGPALTTFKSAIDEELKRAGQKK
jgi:protein-disulfide isomerase